MLIRLILLLIALLAFLILIKKPYYGYAMYYFGVFIRRHLFANMQVRYQVMIQLMLIFFCLMAACISYHTEYGYRRIKIKSIKKAFYVVLFVCIVEAFVGRRNNYSYFQILVDVYKVLEIFIIYYFLSYTIRKTVHFEKCFSLLLIEMCVFAIYELFTTKRGGTGLNIIMSCFPLLFARGFYFRNKRYWLTVLISCTSVLVSQTRTYMIGFLIGILIIVLINRGAKKQEILSQGMFLMIAVATGFVLYIYITHNTFFTNLFLRISALSQGFESTGQHRLYEIQKAIEKFKEAPLFGKGYGYLEFVYIQLMGWFYWGDYMHNTYVEILCKTGIFGVVLYGGIVVTYIHHLIKSIKISNRMKMTFSAAFLTGGVAGTVSWMIIYFAAPLSSYGYIFVPGIMSLLFFELDLREHYPKGDYNA